MNITYPYSEDELKQASYELSPEMLPAETIQKIVKDNNDNNPKDQAELNARITKHNGIEVVDLINSPNLQTLSEKYHQSQAEELVAKFENELQLSNVQAWATFVMIFEILS